jgi:Na+-driven multidrug efflux pump
MGETSLAVSNVIRSIYMIISIPVFALAATSNTLVSNTIGAGNKDDVIPLIWRILRMALLVSGIFMAFVMIFPKEVLSVYTSSTDLIDASVVPLRVLMLVLPIISVGNIFFNAVSGTGNTRTALVLEIGTLVVYLFYIWLVTVHLKAPLEICWTSEHVYAFFIFIFSYIYMMKGDWRSRKI